MSLALNPYQSPETAAVPVSPLIAQGALTDNMLIYLKGASPWLRFVGVMGFLSAGLTVLWGLVSLIFIPLTREIWDELPGITGMLLGGTMTMIFIGLGVLIFFPSLFIYRFGEKIRRYLRTGTDQDLEQAFRNNKSLWKFVGILCIINLAFLPLMIIGNIIAVFASAVN